MRSLIGVLLVCAGCRTTGDLPYVSDWVPFDDRDGMIRFPVSIDGLPARGALDTAVVGPRIDSHFAKRRLIRGHRTMVAEPFALVLVGENGAGPPLEIENAIILERPMGSDVVLDLGFFWGLVLQIDFPNARFRFFTRNASTLMEQANTTIEVAPDGRVYVKAEVGGDERWLLFDAGARPRGGAMPLEAMKVGPYEVLNASVPVEHSPRRAGKSTVRMGYDVLKHFVVTIDLELGLLHLYGVE